MNLVRITRIARGYSLDAVARTMDTHPSRIWRIELGAVEPKVTEMYGLGRIFEVDHEALFVIGRYADPKEALERVLDVLEPHECAKPAVTKLAREARRRIRTMERRRGEK